jgi:hypothetical protein
MLSANLWLVGEVLAGALRRKRSEDALVKSELMKSAILQSLTSGVASDRSSGIRAPVERALAQRARMSVDGCGGW